MAGTREGGLRTAATNKQKYGDNYYSRIGKQGGEKRVPKGFALMDREKVSAAGQKGGLRSKRTKGDAKNY